MAEHPTIEVIGLEFLVQVDELKCWTEICWPAGHRLGRHQRIMSVSNEVLTRMLKAALLTAVELAVNEGGVRIWVDGGDPVFADDARLLDVQALDKDGKRGWRVESRTDEPAAAGTQADPSAQLHLPI